MSKIFTLFTKIAGTVSALFGLICVLGVFFMTILATLLKTTSQVPLSILYSSILLLCLIMIFLIFRLQKRTNKL